MSNDRYSKPYIRAVFTCYWWEAPPSTEIFFFSKPTMEVTLTSISALENEALSALQGWDGKRAEEIIYVGHREINLFDDEITSLGSKILGPMPVTTPVEDAPTGISNPPPLSMPSMPMPSDHPKPAPEVTTSIAPLIVPLTKES